MNRWAILLLLLLSAAPAAGRLPAPPPPPAIADPAARFAEAERYFDLVAYREAEPIYLELIERPHFDRRHDAIVRLGEIYLLGNRVDDLDRLTARAVRDYPNSRHAHAGRAAALALLADRSTGWTHKLRQANGALDHAAKAVALEPGCALSRFVRGMIWLHMPPLLARVEDAAREFEAVRASTDPRRDRLLPDTLYFLGRAYRRMRKNDLALAALREGVLRYPYAAPMRDLYLQYGGELPAPPEGPPAPR